MKLNQKNNSQVNFSFIEFIPSDSYDFQSLKRLLFNKWYHELCKCLVVVLSGLF